MAGLDLFESGTTSMALRKSKAFKWKENSRSYSLQYPIIFNNLSNRAFLPLKVKFDKNMTGSKTDITKYELREIKFENKDRMEEYKAALQSYASNQATTEGSWGADERDRKEIPEILLNRGRNTHINQAPGKKDFQQRILRSLTQSPDKKSAYDLSFSLILDNVVEDVPFEIGPGDKDGLLMSKRNGDTWRKEAWAEILGKDYLLMRQRMKENMIHGYFSIREKMNDFSSSIPENKERFEDSDYAINNINITPNSYIIPEDGIAGRYVFDLEKSGINLIENPKISNTDTLWKYGINYKDDYLQVLSNPVYGKTFEILPGDVEDFDFSNDIDSMLHSTDKKPKEKSIVLDSSDSLKFAKKRAGIENEIVSLDSTQHLEFIRDSDIDGYQNKIKIPITSSDDKERIIEKMSENSNYLFDSGLHYSTDNNTDEKWALVLVKPNKSKDWRDPKNYDWKIFNYADAVDSGKDPLVEFQKVLLDSYEGNENASTKVFKLYGEDGLDMFYESASEGEIDFWSLWNEGKFTIGSYDSRGAEMMSSEINMNPDNKDGAGWSLDGELQERPEMLIEQPILVYDKQDSKDGNILFDIFTKLPDGIPKNNPYAKKDFLDRITGKEQQEWEEWLKNNVPKNNVRAIWKALGELPDNQALAYDVKYADTDLRIRYSHIRGRGPDVPLNKKIMARKPLNKKETLTVGERFDPKKNGAVFAKDLRFKRTYKDKFGRKRVYRSNPAGGKNGSLIIWKDQNTAKAVAKIGRYNGWLVRTIPTKRGFVNIATKPKVGENKPNYDPNQKDFNKNQKTVGKYYRRKNR